MKKLYLICDGYTDEVLPAFLKDWAAKRLQSFRSEPIWRASSVRSLRRRRLSYLRRESRTQFLHRSF